MLVEIELPMTRQEACICSIYYMILKTSAEDVGSMIFPVKDVSIHRYLC
jgi:hypothetical protein